jgi:hypothetical protein
MTGHAIHISQESSTAYIIFDMSDSYTWLFPQFIPRVNYTYTVVLTEAADHKKRKVSVFSIPGTALLDTGEMMILLANTK